MLDSEEKNGTVHRVVKNRDVVGAGCVKDSDSKILTDEAEVEDRWEDYFEKLLNEEFEWDKDCLSDMGKVSGPAKMITYGEVKAAITLARSGNKLRKSILRKYFAFVKVLFKSIFKIK